MCYDALCFDSLAGGYRASERSEPGARAKGGSGGADRAAGTENEIIVERAVAIEEAIFTKCGSSVGDAYRASE